MWKLNYHLQCKMSQSRKTEYRQLSLHRLGGTAGGVYLAAALGHSTNFSITDKLLRPSHRKPSHLRCQANPQTQVPTAVSNNPPTCHYRHTRRKPSISFSLGSSAGKQADENTKELLFVICMETHLSIQIRMLEKRERTGKQMALR